MALGTPRKMEQKVVRAGGRGRVMWGLYTAIAFMNSQQLPFPTKGLHESVCLGVPFWRWEEFIKPPFTLRV